MEKNTLLSVLLFIQIMTLAASLLYTTHRAKTDVIHGTSVMLSGYMESEASNGAKIYVPFYTKR